ncbi:MAG: methyltransferase domain-containing protein [Candidatus Hydrogenedentes bacterium]|nr:methyltransferase domain-containing protein [Candidatus Hydrogenedentota bacterium]
MKGQEFLAQVLHKPPFSKLHPQVAAFLKDYLKQEKVVEFDGKYVVNTHFPPYPSGAFDNMAAQFNEIGEVTQRSLFSVTMAVTNRCPYNCWHCYNAGRSQQDVPLSALEETARQLQELNVVSVTLTGGEPLLRSDLEKVAGAFGDKTCLFLNTTGAGLTLARARALKDSGLFAMGVSLDSVDVAEHDGMRGRKGAFATAVKALDLAGKAGLYPYIVAVGTHKLIQPERFESFMRFAAECGALEVHLIEPSATGKLASRRDVLLTREEKQQILDYQREVAKRDDLPILSTFLYVESAGAFGCGAGLTHLYIDGSGEVCPCNLVPLSFGNVTREPITHILDRMGKQFCKPQTCCVGKTLAGHIGGDCLPLCPEVSEKLCDKYLPKRHPVPRFFQIRSEAHGDVGAAELKDAYDRIHGSYDAFWLVEAGKPIQELVDRLPWTGRQRVFEAGCGTGYATVLIADRVGASGEVYATDLSEGMLAEARVRARARGVNNVRFVAGDALELLESAGPFDTIFSSWVLGYIPLAPFFTRANRALAPGGRLAFVVHKENSPREPLDIFWEIVAEDPSVLEKRVAFDFPRDMDHLRTELKAAGFELQRLWDGKITFRYDTPEDVLDHLLKSGAGTAFYDVVDPARRKGLEQRFLDTIRARQGTARPYKVVHDYVSCIARTICL